jgi:hypothetical protein
MMGLQKKKKDKNETWYNVSNLKNPELTIWLIFIQFAKLVIWIGFHWVELIFFIINLILKYKIP